MKERGWTASAALWADKMAALPGVPILARQRVLFGAVVKDGGRVVAVLPEVMESDLLILAGGAKLLGLCEAFLLAHRRWIVNEMEAGGMPKHLDEFADAVSAQVDAMGGGDALIEPGGCIVTGGG